MAAWDFFFKSGAGREDDRNEQYIPLNSLVNLACDTVCLRSPDRFYIAGYLFKMDQGFLDRK